MKFSPVLVAAALCCLPGTHLFAQSWLWTRTVVSTQDMNEGNAVATDLSGNVFMTGSFIGTATFGTQTVSGNGYNDLYLAKYDANGNVLWVTSAGGTGIDKSTCAATDAAGNCYVAGTFTSPNITFGTFTLNHSNGNAPQLFLVKFDASGNVMWAQMPVGNGSHEPAAVKTDPAGNVCLTGWFQYGSVTFGTTTLPNVGQTDLFVAKYDAAGNVLWAKSGGGSLADRGAGMDIDAAGNIYVSGSFENAATFGNIALTSVGFVDVCLLKYAPAGNLFWAKSAGGPGPEAAGNVLADAAGGVYYTGMTASAVMNFGNAQVSTVASYDVFVCKYNNNGNFIWAKAGGSSGYDMGYALAQDTAGTIYVGGQCNSPFTFDNATLNGGFFLLQLDTAGNLACAAALAYGGNVCTLDADQQGNLYLCSDYWSAPNTFLVGGDTLPSMPVQNAFLTKRGPMIASLLTTPVACDHDNGSAAVTLAGNNTSHYVYSWSPGGANDTVITGLAPGQYTFTVTDPDGCVSTQAATVSFAPPPAISVTGNATLQPGDSLQLQATANGMLSWNPGTAISCSTCPDPFVFPLSTTTYCATVTDSNACTATACVDINVEDCEVFVPNAFSPNGDGQNDVLFVRGNCIAQMHFAVYDRWGTQVFLSTDPASGWNGSYKGEALEPAVFSFTLESRLLSGTEIVKSGSVTLVR